MAHGQQQVEVDQDDAWLERVAAVDVAKASRMVRTRTRTPPRQARVSPRPGVPATTGAIAELAAQLATQGIQRVVLESTSDYWRPFFYLLEGAGLWVWLVNARQVKNVSGRPKTDKLDAVWLAKLNERGMLRPASCPRRRSGPCATPPVCAPT
jgi:transposase